MMRTMMTFVIFCITASSSKTWLQFQAQNETCIVECLTTLDGDLCKSVCGDNITLYEDYQEALQEDEEEKSIIEAGKVYNSRLNVVVYSMMTGQHLYKS